MFKRLFDPFAGVFFDDEDVPATTPPEPVAAETPPAPEPAAPGPWAADLEAYFEDETTRAAADRFLREKIQPHTTRLEQQYAETEGARRLLADFQEDPYGTFLAVGQEIGGEELSDRIAQLIAEGESPADAQEIAETEATPPADLDPRVARWVEQQEQAEAQAAYAAELERVGISESERALFHPFVMVAEGDFDAAKQGYEQWKATAAESLGLTPPAPETAPPPATLGTVAGDAPAPPAIAKKYASLDDALDDVMDEMRAARTAPTVVGQV